jgi:hypothetical protein
LDGSGVGAERARSRTGGGASRRDVVRDLRDARKTKFLATGLFTKPLRRAGGREAARRDL